MTKIIVGFKIGEKVKIFETKVWGKITGIYIDSEGTKSYLVKYADRNRAVFETYFKTDELRKK